MAGLLYGLYVFFKQDTEDTISNNEAVVSQVEDSRMAKLTFNQQDFTIATPANWALYKKTESPDSKVYYLKSTEKNVARTLVIYVDADTKSFAVNKTIPVSVAGSKLSVGQVSDTCSNFVGQTSGQTALQSQKQPDTLAKWQNITFLCDMSNVNRNAIGISSTDGLNTVGVAGKSSIKRNYFFIYTDHSNTADTALFVEILRSFEAK